MTSIWRRIAREQAGPDYARAYARRFRELAERGTDVHGEAALVGRLRAAPARVLDAGCGTGRVAARLAELGYQVVGCDVDEPMVAEARAQWPDLAWHVADLAGLATPDAPRDLRGPFDVVVVAGNVLPMVEPGTLDDVSRGLGAVLAGGGVVVTGFGLDAAHLPAGCPVLALADAEASWRRAGLRVRSRLSGWDGAGYDGGGYVVAVLGAARD